MFGAPASGAYKGAPGLCARSPPHIRSTAVTGKAPSPEAARFAAEQESVVKQQADEIGAAIRNQDSELLELFNTGGLAWETLRRWAARLRKA
jgi:hypothetical protein